MWKPWPTRERRRRYRPGYLPKEARSGRRSLTSKTYFKKTKDFRNHNLPFYQLSPRPSLAVTHLQAPRNRWLFILALSAPQVGTLALGCNVMHIPHVNAANSFFPSFALLFTNFTPDYLHLISIKGFRSCKKFIWMGYILLNLP